MTRSFRLTKAFADAYRGHNACWAAEMSRDDNRWSGASPPLPVRPKSTLIIHSGNGPPTSSKSISRSKRLAAGEDGDDDHRWPAVKVRSIRRANMPRMVSLSSNWLAGGDEVEQLDVRTW